MKKLIIVTLENKSNEFINSRLNSLIIKKDKKYFFNSKFNNNLEEIEIENIILKNKNFDLLVHKHLINLISPSLEQASWISNEPIVTNKIEELKTPIYSMIYKYNKLDLGKYDIFNFFVDLFISFLNGHKLINGNKRFSFQYLINISYYFGWYFKFSKGIYIKDRNNIIKFFTEKIENKNNNIFNLNDPIRKEIKNWINENLIVSINFRYNNFIK